MSRDETERYMNIQVESLFWKGENGSQLSFLYPAIYTITCRLNIRFIYFQILKRGDEQDMHRKEDLVVQRGYFITRMSLVEEGNQYILYFRFFPYDRQNCTLTISSWTNSKSALDYYADAEVNMASFIPNEEWEVKSFKIFRHEVCLFLLFTICFRINTPVVQNHGLFCKLPWLFKGNHFTTLSISSFPHLL